MVDPHRNSNGLPLRGTAIIITRPVGRGAALAAQVRRLGGTPVLWPTASLRLIEDGARARAQLKQARGAAAVIFTSVAAVRFAFALQADWRPARGTRVLAVGPSTAGALRRRGLVVETPATRFDTEGLLATPVLQAAAGRSVAIVCAPGGRTTLGATLCERGARVQEAHVYRRVLPRWTVRHRGALSTAPARHLLLLSSTEAVAALERLLDSAVWRQLRHAIWIVSSERVAQTARSAGARQVQVARSALPADLLAAAVSIPDLNRPGC